jgi:type I restriction enzyme, R subunit
MIPDISERSFEEAIECGLLQGGPDACPGAEPGFGEPVAVAWGDMPVGGYLKRAPENYDRTLCLVPQDTIDFVLATQPKEWSRLKQHHGARVTEQFL